MRSLRSIMPGIDGDRNTGGRVGFYVAGGTMPSDAASYVTRTADEELYHGLRQGDFCYVLASRQIGKSSLMNRVAARLREDAIATAEIDLTGIGQNLTIEQWYDGIVYELGRALGMKAALRTAWQRHDHLGPLHRFVAVLREGVLAQHIDPVAIFIDEIEVVRNLPFRADEFFASLRECYNRRAADPLMKRLALCVLGTAAPADLIRDPRITPFNIGRRIDLTDFTEAEALPLSLGMANEGRNGARLLRRVLYWTGGHPYLTQSLCHAIAADPRIHTAGGVDALCRQRLLSRRARESDANLVPIREFLLRCTDDPTDILELYGRVRSGRRVSADETDAGVRRLLLSGIVGTQGGDLCVRNRVYGHVFDRRWIAANMPDAEVRRQRLAFRRGLLRATAVYGGVAAAMGALAVTAYHQKKSADVARNDAVRQMGMARAEAERSEAMLYLTDMTLARLSLETHSVVTTHELLDVHRERERDFEWRYLWGLSHQEQWTLSGHNLPVYSVAFSRNGRWLASGGADKMVRLWDVASGQTVRIFRGHTKGVMTTAFSPDGQLLVTGGDDGRLFLWDSQTGKQLRAWQVKPLSGFMEMAFSPDGRWLAVGSQDGTVRLYDPVTKKTSSSLSLGTGAITGICFSPDSRRLAVSNGGQVCTLVCAPALQAQIQRIPLVGVAHLAFSRDGTQLIAASNDGSISMLDIVGGKTSRRTERQAADHLSQAVSPDGRWIATGGADSAVRIWKIGASTPPLVLDGHRGPVAAVTFTPDGKGLATGSFDGTVKLWTLPSPNRSGNLPGAPGAEALRLSAFPPQTRRLVFSPNGEWIAGMLRDKSIRLWDATTGHPRKTWRPESGAVTGLAFSADSRHLLLGGKHQPFLVYDVMAGTHRSSLRSIGASDSFPLALSGDQRRLAAIAMQMKTIELHDLQKETTPPRLLTGHTARVSAVTFSPDSRLLASVSWDRTARLWNVDTGELYWKSLPQKKPLSLVAFSPDGDTLAIGSKSGEVTLWKHRWKRESMRLEAPHDLVSIAFSEDGTLLKALDREGRIFHWKAPRVKGIFATTW